MFEIEVSRSEGYVYDGEPIYTVVVHPSGFVLLDFAGEFIESFKTDEIITVEKW